MKIIALKELPQGQQPGDELVVTDEQADVLIRLGAAKAKDDEPKRRYARRDLVAEK
jgi:hypothetical protein